MKASYQTSAVICISLFLVGQRILGSSAVSGDEKNMVDQKLDSLFKFVSNLVPTTEIVGSINLYYCVQKKLFGSVPRGDWSILEEVHVGRTIQSIPKIAEVIRSARHLHRFNPRRLNVVIADTSDLQVFEFTGANVSNPFDYYVFYQLSYDRQQQKLLLTRRQIHNLKYKIECVTDSDGSDLKVFSRCFYCDGGQSRVSEFLKTAPFASLFPDQTRDLNGTLLKVTSSKGNSRSMNYKELENGTAIFDGGYSHKIFYSLQQKFGFKYEFRLSNGFGIMLPNGSFTGAIGALQRGDYDFAIEAGLKSERFAATEYMPPGTYECLTFLTRIPQSETNWILMYATFTPQMWTALSCSMFIFSIGYGLLAVVANILMVKRYKLRKGLQMGFEFVISSLLDQSWEGTTGGNKLSDELVALRLAMIAWLLPVVVIGTAYKAKLTTLMAYPAVGKVPTNFDQLAASDYKIYLHAIPGGLPEFIFRTTTNPSLINVRSRLIREKSLFKCIDETVRLKAACITLGANGMFEASKNFSNTAGIVMVRMAPTNLYPFLPGAPILRKGQPFAQHFASTIRTMFDMGLMYKFQGDEETSQALKGRRWARYRTMEEPWRLPQADGPKPTTKEEIYGVLIVYAVLIIASLMVFITERLHYRICRLINYLYTKWRNAGVLVVTSDAALNNSQCSPQHSVTHQGLHSTKT